MNKYEQMIMDCILREVHYVKYTHENMTYHSSSENLHDHSIAITNLHNAIDTYMVLPSEV